MAYRDNPPTDCKSCRWAEMTRLERFREWITPVDRMALYMESYGRAFRVACGLPPKTWYQKHREAYELTGDEIDKRRMVRHVVDDVLRDWKTEQERKRGRKGE